MYTYIYTSICIYIYIYIYISADLPRASCVLDYSQAARQQGSQAARQPGSQAARQQGSKAARQQGSQDLAVDSRIWQLTAYLSSYRGLTNLPQAATGRHRPPHDVRPRAPPSCPGSSNLCSRLHRTPK